MKKIIMTLPLVLLIALSGCEKTKDVDFQVMNYGKAKIVQFYDCQKDIDLKFPIVTNKKIKNLSFNDVTGDNITKDAVECNYKYVQTYKQCFIYSLDIKIIQHKIKNNDNIQISKLSLNINNRDFEYNLGYVKLETKEFNTDSSTLNISIDNETILPLGNNYKLEFSADHPVKILDISNTLNIPYTNQDSFQKEYEVGDNKIDLSFDNNTLSQLQFDTIITYSESNIIKSHLVEKTITTDITKLAKKLIDKLDEK